MISAHNLHFAFRSAAGVRIVAPTCNAPSAVIVVKPVDWHQSYDDASLSDLLPLSDDDLTVVDPLAMNLIIAKGIPSLADLHIGRYQRILNDWVKDFTRRCLPRWEAFFHDAPHDFRNDIQFFRLGLICQYLENSIQRRSATNEPYSLHESKRPVLNGVIDTHQGTCGNLAAGQRIQPAASIGNQRSWMDCWLGGAVGS